MLRDESPTRSSASFGRAVKILINFAPLKSGGGQTVGLNFLLGLSPDVLKGREIYFVVARDSQIHQAVAAQHSLSYLVVPCNPVLRAFFEFFRVPGFIRRNQIDAVYSYFGFGCFPRGVVQVCGSADSNLYYPEVDFWAHYTGMARLKKYLVDRFRLFGVKHCDAVIFENDALLERAKQLHDVRKAVVVRPSIADLSEGEAFELPSTVPATSIKGLFLCGWQLNKNVMAIPEIALEMKRRGKLWHFILTAPVDGSAVQRRFDEKVRDLDVGGYVTVVGPVRKEQLGSIYKQVDFVFLLSKLESFSNNIIEAWHFGKPLVVAREEWAKAICGQGAIYVDRDSASAIADTVINWAADGERLEALVEAGRGELGSYPSIEERICQELDYVESIAKSV